MVRIDVPEDMHRPEIVREALRGRVHMLPPSIAADVIPELDVSNEERLDIVREALADPDVEPYVKVATVHTLGRFAADVATSELVAVLRADGDEDVGAAAATLLGRLGGLEQLPELEQFKRGTESDVNRRHVAFAEALIVHRFGDTKHDVELPRAKLQRPPEPVGALQFISRKPGLSRAKRAIASARRQFPSLDPKTLEVHELQCGPQLLEVIVVRQATALKAMKSLTTRPAMPAIIALASEETHDFYPAYVVLSRPERAGTISLLVARLDGGPAFVGKGVIKASAAEAELQSVVSPGVPAVSVRIRVSDRGFEISGLSAVRAAPSRSPERVQVSPS